MEDGAATVLVEFVFFSSRRRHTRYWRDWSSDVCSSDLALADRRRTPGAPGRARNRYRRTLPLWLPQDSFHMLVSARQVAFQYGHRLPVVVPDRKSVV